MIVKKLRVDRNWSQEQLAVFTGLSVRTIQRVESGQSASVETLKSLASVFEVNISTLTEEIAVIDKKSEKWKEQPLWFRYAFWGIPSRRFQLWMEFGFLLTGIILLIFGGDKVFYFLDLKLTAILFIIGAYITGWTVRYGDNKHIW